MKEIDAQGNVVLQINGASGTRFGYALWQESLYGPPVGHRAVRLIPMARRATSTDGRRCEIV